MSQAAVCEYRDRFRHAGLAWPLLAEVDDGQLEARLFRCHRRCLRTSGQCREGYSVLYKRAPRLFADLATARSEKRLSRVMAALERMRLLIIDDWGPEPLSAEQRRDLLEIVDDRDDRGSLLITSQLPVGRWHDVVGDMTLGDAIVDRIVHRAHRLELKGASLRKRRSLPDGLTDSQDE